MIFVLSKGILSGPKSPTVTPPKAMPDETDPGMEMASRRRYAQRRTGGRASTILDDFGGDSPGGGGGGEYSRDTMGGR